MDTSVQLFSFRGNQIRTFQKDGGTCFIVSDLGKALDLKNINKNVADLDEDEKGITISYTPGGPQQMSYVTEPGMYGLVFASRKEIAKDFKRWLKHEVLPAIRKNGFYADLSKMSLFDLVVFSRDIIAKIIEAFSDREILFNEIKSLSAHNELKWYRRAFYRACRDFEGVLVLIHKKNRTEVRKYVEQHTLIGFGKEA